MQLLEADMAPGGPEGWPPKGGLKVSAEGPIKGRAADMDSAENIFENIIRGEHFWISES